jgi:hypothetical protein
VSESPAEPLDSATTKRLKADVFESPAKPPKTLSPVGTPPDSSGTGAKPTGPLQDIADTGVYPIGTSTKGSPSKTLEPYMGQLDELAKKVAGDNTLDSQPKVHAAIEAELLKLKTDLNLSEDDYHHAFNEVRKLASAYKGSDPDFGASGGIREK